MEVVWGNHELFVGLNQILGRHDTECQFDGWEFSGLVALGSRHPQFELGVVLHGHFVRHFGHVAERLAILPAHDGAVSRSVFSLVLGRFKRGFTAVPHQHRRGFQCDFFGEVLGRKLSGDVNGDVVALKDDRGGGDFEVDVFNRLDHFGQAASREKHGSEQSRKYAHGCCEFRAKVTNSRTQISPPRPPCWRICGGGC